VIVDRRRGGPVDCRVAACELVVFEANGGDVPGSPVARVRVGYDPGGPGPVRANVTVTPHEDLRDGDTVTVAGDGLPLHAYAPAPGAPGAEGGGPRWPAYVYQCRADATSYRGCHVHPTVRGLTAAGDFTTPFTVRSRIYTPTGASHDCLAEPCALIATNNGGEFSEAGLVPLTFDPSGPVAAAPTVTVTPSTGLEDGQVVQITARHFEPRTSVNLSLCPAGATGQDFLWCHDVLDTSMATDAQGRADLTHAVHARFAPSRGPAVDCRVTTCEFVVTWWSDVNDAPSAPIQLDPGTPLVDQQLRAQPMSGLRGGQEIIVRGSGYYPTDFTRVTECVVRRQHPDGDFCVFVDRLVNPPGGDFTSFSTTFTVRRTFRTYDGPGRINCAIRHCYLASWDDENEQVRSARLRFAPA
jgi:hypothetical protein